MMMKKRIKYAAFAVVLLFFAGWPFFVINGASAQEINSKPDCDINMAACKKNSRGAEIMFDITPKPVKAMRELTFTVTLKNSAASGKIIVALGMPDMYMGENKVVLKRSEKDTYSGKGIIPKCSSGMRLWRATVETPEGKKADFLFSINY